MSTATTTIQKPSDYQKTLLKASGIRRRPRTYAGAQKLIHETCPPSEAMVRQLGEYGLEIPQTFGEARALLDHYEAEHPEAKQARIQRRLQKARETRAAARAEKAAQSAETAPLQIDGHLQRCYDAAVRQHGEDAASVKTLGYLRALARQLPEGSEPRLLAFGALRAGMSQKSASVRIGELKDRVAAL